MPHVDRPRPPIPNPEFFKQYRARYGLQVEMEKQAQSLGIGLGEMVHAVTDYLGITQCSRCKRWEAAMDKLRLIGWKVQWADVAQVALQNKSTDRIVVTWIEEEHGD